MILENIETCFANLRLWLFIWKSFLLLLFKISLRLVSSNFVIYTPQLLFCFKHKYSRMKTYIFKSLFLYFKYFAQPTGFGVNKSEKLIQ